MVRSTARRRASAFLPLALLPSLFALQCSLEGLNGGHKISDGGRPPSSGVSPFISDLDTPEELVVTSDYLYFTSGRRGGDLERCPIDGGAPDSIVHRLANASSLAESHGALGWVMHRGGIVILGWIGLEGMQFRTIAADQARPLGMAPFARGDAVWTNADAPVDGISVARRMPDGKVIALSRGMTEASAIIIPAGGRDVVWGHSKGLAETVIDGDGEDGRKACTFVKSSAGQQSIVAPSDDPRALYWLTKDGQVLSTRRPPAADALQDCANLESTIVPLASGPGTFWDIEVDAKYVYFTVDDGGNQGSLRRVPRAGGPVEVLLTSLDQPRGIALTTDYIFVAVSGEGTILRIPRSR